MLNFDPQGHDPGRVMILYESPPEEVHTHQFLQFYHKVNDFSAYPLDYKVKETGIKGFDTSYK